MVVTDSKEWADKIRYLSTQAKDDPLEYIHGEIGYNYRLTNTQAAIGCAQLERLDEFIDAKRRIASGYEQELKNIPGIELIREESWSNSIWWLYTVLVDEDIYGIDSRILLKKLAELNIESRPLWQPMHLSPAHKDGRTFAEYPVAERLYKEALSLPCSVGLVDHQQERVIEAIRLQQRKNSSY